MPDILAVLEEIVPPDEPWPALWWRDLVLRVALPHREIAIVHAEATALAAAPGLVRALQTEVDRLRLARIADAEIIGRWQCQAERLAGELAAANQHVKILQEGRDQMRDDDPTATTVGTNMAEFITGRTKRLAWDLYETRVMHCVKAQRYRDAPRALVLHAPSVAEYDLIASALHDVLEELTTEIELHGPAAETSVTDPARVAMDHIPEFAEPPDAPPDLTEPVEETRDDRRENADG